jgi:hypothetical protein
MLSDEIAQRFACGLRGYFNHGLLPRAGTERRWNQDFDWHGCSILECSNVLCLFA